MSRSYKFFLASAFLIAALFSFQFPAHTGTPACTLCDIDDDGIIEPADGQDDFNLFINILLQFINPTPQQFCAADVNQDGFVNGLDIQSWVNVCTVSSECDDNADCDDSIACTNDICSSGSCTNTPNNNLCNDSIACTEDICNAGAGCSNAPIQCGNDPACIQCGPNQICNPEGQCVLEDYCGNGIVDPGEQCETDGDCAGGNVCAGCVCVTSNICGDGQITGDEVCDTNGDIGCASSEGYICAQTCLPDCTDCDPSGQASCCGDNVEDDGEECDSGSFCEDGAICFYQNDCLGIGDESCEYRAEFSGNCSETCTLIEDLTVADFNRDFRPQALSAQADEFYSVKSEGQCTYSYSRGDALDYPKGSSLKIDYAIESQQKPACKITVRVSPKLFEVAGINPNVFKTLKFYLKGSVQPFPKELKVEWKGTTFVARPVIAKNVAASWQLYSVPLTGELEFSESPEFSLALDQNSNPKAGSFFLDHISLSRSASPVWPSCLGKSCDRIEFADENTAANP